MLTSRHTLIRRIASALDSTPSRIPVLLGATGSGRSTVLRQVEQRLDRTAVLLVDVERTATTPERFLQTLISSSPFPHTQALPSGARAAFDAALAFLGSAQANGSSPATFLLDEFLELRTFESFPGLRRVLHELVDALAESPNRFVLSSRYTQRALRLLRERSSRFEIVHVPALTIEETLDIVGPESQLSSDTHDGDDLARTVQALANGQPGYVRAIADELRVMRDGGAGADAISALAALFAPEGRLARDCAFCYELRLHRARGYGALKAILDILAVEEGLTLTEISQRLQRTPGSTKDYLSWLEDVDLVVSHHKRYSFADPLLRVWVRLHCRVSLPNEDEVAHEIHRYALPRLPKPQPQQEPALAMAAAGGVAVEEEKKDWGIIEID